MQINLLRKMKKVDIIIGSSLNNAIGPVQTIKRVNDSKAWFLEKGYDVTVFSIDDLSPFMEGLVVNRLSENKRKIIRKIINFLSLHTKWYGRNRIRRSHEKARKMLDYYSSLKRTPDIVEFHDQVECYEYLKGYRIDGTKTILFIHADGSDDGNKMILSYYPKLRNTKDEKKMDIELKYTIENIDAFACITKIERTNMIKKYPILNNKIFSVVNGITDLTAEQLEDTAKIRMQSNSKKYRLVCVGSMNGRKGHAEILEAINRMNQSIRRDLQITFVGSGFEMPQLIAKAEEYGIRDYVNFVGVVPNEKVYKYQAQSNINILISKLEGLPLSLIEGLRSGLALISTNVSGIPELIDDGINGKLINYDIEALLNLFNNLDKYDWDTMGVKSRKKFEDYYNFNRMREDFLVMFKKVAPVIDSL